MQEMCFNNSHDRLSGQLINGTSTTYIPFENACFHRFLLNSANMVCESASPLELLCL